MQMKRSRDGAWTVSTGVIPIHNLNRFGEVALDQVPNPGGAIANENHFFG
ncbi:MAG: hypothetical protein Kow0088_17600 [Anaerolineales bacterium]